MKYLCKNCGEPCKKPPLKAQPGWQSASFVGVGLGTFRCPNKCKPCKVKREK